MRLSKSGEAAWVDEFRGRRRRCARERLGAAVKKARWWEMRPLRSGGVVYFDFLFSDAGKAWLSSVDGLQWAVDVYSGAGTIEAIRRGYERKSEGLRHEEAIGVAVKWLGGGSWAEGHELELCGKYLCECECAGCVVVGLGACRSGSWADSKPFIFSEWVKAETEWCCGEAWGEGLIWPVRALSQHPQQLLLPPVSDDLKARFKEEAARLGWDPDIADRR